MKRGISMSAVLVWLLAFPVSAGASQPSDFGAPEDMIGMRIGSSGGMSRYSALSFELREENDAVLFSCNFFTHNQQEIVLEKVPVDSEYMQRLRDMAKKYGFARMHEQDKSNKIHVPDAPTYGATMYWPEEKRLRLNFWPARDELESFFWEVANSCVNKPGAPEELSALYYDYVHADDSECFNFALHTDPQGAILLSAHYFTENNDKVALRDLPVQPAHLQKLREIVRAHSMADMPREALHDVVMRRSPPPYPYGVLRLYWPGLRFIQLGQLPSGSEELKQFFQDLAEEYAKHWEPTQQPDLLSWLTFTCTRENKSDSFVFHLRNVHAQIELYAQYVGKDGEQRRFYATVDRKHMDELREIVKRYGIVERLKKMPYAERERSVMEDKLPCVLAIDWWDDPSLRLPSFPSPGGEELEAFFRKLAQQYEQQSKRPK